MHSDDAEEQRTSTFQPSSFICSISSRCVLTLLASTAVHVGKMAPSPESEAAARTISYQLNPQGLF